MTRRRIHPIHTMLAIFAAIALITPAQARAHCDSLDGPVVTSARAALAAGDVALVLHWVAADDEARHS